MQTEAEIISAHHERLDGSGYPRGLVGDEIPLGARIVAIADSYDALISPRPYRAAWPPREAEAMLQKEAGRRLYRPAVEALSHILAAGKEVGRP
jgi:HD-GYP domain-containing protein (c-di-GMP phosphodiesterase class II)